MFDLTLLDSIASMVTSLTIVGGGAFWAIRQFYLKPRDKRKEEEERKRNEVLQDALKPINEFLGESRADRKALNEVALKNTSAIDGLKRDVGNLDDRLIVVETKSGIRGQVTYTEVYKGDETNG